MQEKSTELQAAIEELKKEKQAAIKELKKEKEKEIAALARLEKLEIRQAAIKELKKEKEKEILTEIAKLKNAELEKLEINSDVSRSIRLRGEIERFVNNNADQKSIDKITILVEYGQELLKDRPDIAKLKQSQASIDSSIEQFKKTGDNEKVKDLTTLKEVMGEEIRNRNKNPSMMSRVINTAHTYYDNSASKRDERDFLQSKISAIKLHKVIMDAELGNTATKTENAGIKLEDVLKTIGDKGTNMSTKNAVNNSKIVLFFDSPEKMKEAQDNGLVDQIRSANNIKKEDISCWLSSDKVARGAAIRGSALDGPRIYDLSENGNIGSVALTYRCKVGNEKFASIAKFTERSQEKAAEAAFLKLRGNNFTDYIASGDYAKDPLVTPEILPIMLNPESNLSKLMNDCCATPKDLKERLGEDWIKIANSIDLNQCQQAQAWGDKTKNFQGEKLDIIVRIQEQHNRREEQTALIVTKTVEKPTKYDVVVAAGPTSTPVVQTGAEVAKGNVRR